MSLTPEPSGELPKVQKFVNDHGIPWPVGYDARSTIDALKVHRYPTLFVVGRDGVITWNDYQQGDLISAITQTLKAVSEDNDPS